MNRFRNIVQSILLSSPLVLAGSVSAAPAIPSLVLAPSVGQEKGQVDNLGIKGYAGTLRIQKFFPTYPIFGLGLDVKYSALDLDHGGTDIEGKRTSLAAVLPVLFPLDILGVKLDKLPKGGGPPLYVGYIFSDELELDGFSENLKGKGWKAGLMLPAPGGAIQVEYSQVNFDDPSSSDIQTLFGSSELDSQSWTISYHLPLVITRN